MSNKMKQINNIIIRDEELIEEIKYFGANFQELVKLVQTEEIHKILDLLNPLSAEFAHILNHDIGIVAGNDLVKEVQNIAQQLENISKIVEDFIKNDQEIAKKLAGEIQKGEK